MNTWNQLVVNHFWIVLIVGIILFGVSVFSAIKMKEKRYKITNSVYSVIVGIIIVFLIVTKVFG